MCVMDGMIVVRRGVVHCVKALRIAKNTVRFSGEMTLPWEALLAIANRPN